MASGEYVQMSGRAGRRGKDDRGICIVMCDEEMDMETAQTLMKGATAPLVSSFKLTYYTLLNVLKRSAGEIDMQRVIAKSFHQFQHDKALPEARSSACAAIAAPTATHAPSPRLLRSTPRRWRRWRRRLRPSALPARRPLLSLSA